MRKNSTLLVVSAMVGLFAVAGRAGAEEQREGWFSPARWDLRAGYGYQYTNTHRPNDFRILQVFPSAVVPMGDPAGFSWLKGRWEWNPELWLGFFTRPYNRPILGATPLQFRYQMEGWGHLKPYGLLGAGILYANVNRRETRQDLNFNLQEGIGTYFAVNDTVDLILEYRHIHVSNAGLDEDNAGLNTHNFLAGVSIKK